MSLEKERDALDEPAPETQRCPHSVVTDGICMQCGKRATKPPAEKSVQR